MVVIAQGDVKGYKVEKLADQLKGQDKVTLTKIVESPATGGDEAGGWTVFMDMEGKEVPFYQLTAGRRGSTLATFGTIDLAALTGGGGEPVKSTAVVDAQVKKLG
ncbi:hypothetical protein [Streptomyces lichenis]|uniref:Lipoprotein n=1 Tax=Streptomyces lichenis TaxID=2306967 RepID=A0ABT0I7G2_9ACTN|nr:hypothetical protein [Streptomyces lichenis]MCK8677269.1 hypothetical protein [Streptomyces lichenis]